MTKKFTALACAAGLFAIAPVMMPTAHGSSGENRAEQRGLNDRDAQHVTNLLNLGEGAMNDGNRDHVHRLLNDAAPHIEPFLGDNGADRRTQDLANRFDALTDRLNRNQ